jgi:hypothetical protein
MSPVLPSIGTKMAAGWGKYLAHAPFEDGATFGEVLKDQVRFRITKPGATTIDDVVPDSAAARELWERDSTKRYVQGVLDLANEVTGAGPTTPFEGFTLATSEAGYVANRAVHHYWEGAPGRDAYEEGLALARAHVDETAAVRKGAWLHLDPKRSAGMLYMVRHPDAQLGDLSSRTRDSLGRGVKTLLHELNHVESPIPEGAAERLSWVSEGTAETLARWPGRVKHAGRVLGFDVPARVGAKFDAEGKPYQEEVDAIRGLLRLTGIDTSRASQFPRAERLLNGTPEDKLPHVLARRIADRHTIGPKAEAKLARRIERVISREVAPDGEHAATRVIQRLARELRAARVDT